MKKNLSIILLVLASVLVASPRHKSLQVIHENPNLVEEQRVIAERDIQRRRLVWIAQRQLGKPYKWGAIGPDAVDCSGLTFMVFRLAGHPIPREMIGQWTSLKPVYSHPKKGDLVFFRTIGNTMSHVGIYIDDSKFINAPLPGAVVRIDNLNDPYWRATYIGARSLY